MVMIVTLEATHDRRLRSQHELDQSLITFGRSKSCHIELDHPEVSRRHFIIKFDGDTYHVIDEGSRHGTVVDNETLEPHIPKRLSKEHVIEVSGFIVTLLWDGQKPKLERTTVVARKLLDELLHGEMSLKHVPSLISTNNEYHFTFSEEKTSFVLGRHPHADFVVNDLSLAKEHVTFLRDITGISLNPLTGHNVLVDGSSITSPVILSHNSKITLGPLEFLFRLSSNENHTPKIVPQINPPEAQKIETIPIVDSPSYDIKHKAVDRQPVFKILDRFFLIGFVFLVVGASTMLFVLI